MDTALQLFLTVLHLSGTISHEGPRDSFSWMKTIDACHPSRPSPKIGSMLWYDTGIHSTDLKSKKRRSTQKTTD